jgi:hypothetical protein
LIFQAAIEAIADVREIRQPAHSTIEKNRERRNRDKLNKE